MRALRITALACSAAALCLAAAQPVVSAVLNGASYSAAVAPGCWVAIFGADLAVSPQNASGTLSTTLARSIGHRGRSGGAVVVCLTEPDQCADSAGGCDTGKYSGFLAGNDAAGQVSRITCALAARLRESSRETARARDEPSCSMPTSRMSNDRGKRYSDPVCDGFGAYRRFGQGNGPGGGLYRRTAGAGALRHSSARLSRHLPIECRGAGSRDRQAVPSYGRLAE